MKKYALESVDNINDHFIYCEEKEIPFIKINKYSKVYYYVEVDLIAFFYNEHNDKTAYCEKIDILGKQMNLFDYLKYRLSDNGLTSFILMDLGICKKRTFACHLGNEVWGIEVKKEYAFKLANSLYDFYYQYIKEFKMYFKIDKGIDIKKYNKLINQKKVNQ